MWIRKPSPSSRTLPEYSFPRPTIKWVLLGALALAGLLYAFARVGGFDAGTARHETVLLLTGGDAANADATCSGTLVGPTLVLTARHCVLSDRLDTTSSLNVIYVKTFDGDVRPATVAYFSEDNDWALLRIAPVKEPIAHVSCAGPYVLGTLHLVGSPYGFVQWAVSDGHYATDRLDPALFSRQSGGDLDAMGWGRLVIAAMAGAPGVSGGPIFNDDGNVVGVAVAGAGPYIGYVPTSEICREVIHAG